MTDLTGQTLGEYQLVELIDPGGTAVVYKGFQPNMNRYVAVKVLSPSLVQDPAAVQQFKQEAELQARMEHRHLLPIYDSGEQDGNYYRVLRYIETGTLRDRLSGFYEPRAAQGLIHYIAEGLDYIHRQGLIHGNLKPATIFLDEQRQPLLTDFGFAHRAGAAPNVYMSPEQLQGGAVDRRTDIYTLGVLLYEMLTGEPPPDGTIASPLAKRPDLPPEVEQVIFKAMAHNPDHRYQMAGEFAKALESALMPKVAPAPQPVQQQPPAAQPAPAPAPQPKKRDTSWLVFLLGGLFILILIACALIFLPTIFGGDGEATPVVTEEIVPPTQPPPSTDEPPPTDAPPPTDVSPPTEAPQPTEAPPSVENPIEPPADSGGDGGIGQICGSVGVGAGAMVLGLGMSKKRRRKSKTDHQA